jgi:hypothetical protein
MIPTSGQPQSFSQEQTLPPPPTEVIIRINILDTQGLSELYKEGYNGYLALSDKELDGKLFLSNYPDTGQGVSGFKTVVSANERIIWQLVSKDSGTLEAIEFKPALQQQLDAVFTILPSRQDIIKQAQTVARFESDVPQEISYSVFLRLTFKNKIFFVRFDPMIQTRTTKPI